MYRRSSLAATAAALAITVVVVAAGAAGAAPQTGAAAATPKITGKGVGRLKVGMLFSKARSLGLVGKAGPGCELVSGSRAASLRSPLKGSVDLTTGSPRRIRNISIRGGAAARGVTVGDPLTRVKAAYPSAKVDKSQV